MLYTSLSKVEKFFLPEEKGEFLKRIGKDSFDDEPLPYSFLVEKIGMFDTLSLTISTPEYEKEWKKYSIWCARQVSKYTDDWRVIYTIQVAERRIYKTIEHEEANKAAGLCITAAIETEEKHKNRHRPTLKSLAAWAGKDCLETPETSTLGTWATAHTAAQMAGKIEDEEVLKMKFLEIVG